MDPALRGRERARRRRTVCRARPDHGRGDTGESLLELLVTVVIIGVCVTALLTAFLMQNTTSDQNRTRATGDVLLSRYAEALANVPYSACSDYGLESVDSIPSTHLPSGVHTGPPDDQSLGYTSRDFDLNVTNVTYWDGTSSAPATFGTSCAVDYGVQQLTLQIRARDGSFNRTLVIHKLETGR